VVVTNRLPPHPNDLIGQRIGGYTIMRLIAEGGMGAVYAAHNPRLGKWAAVKVILGELVHRAETLERFDREAKAIAAIEDPHIIDVFDLHDLDGATYILMPLVDGVSLEAMCRQRGPLPIELAFYLGAQAGSGLKAAHAVGIVHRDIKPGNLLVGPRYERKFFVRVVDFGIAKLLAPQLAAGFRTRTRAVMGTIGYMAPEQARAEKDVDARADVYSLGVVLYRMVTGHIPYEDETMYGLIEKQIQRAPFPQPRELRPDLPPIWNDTILASLEIDRKQRLGSVDELIQGLAHGIPNGEQKLRYFASRLCANTSLPPEAATLSGDLEEAFTRWSSLELSPPRSPTPPRRSGRPLRRAWFAAGLMAGSALGAGGVLLATARSATSEAPLVERAEAGGTDLAVHAPAPTIVAAPAPRTELVATAPEPAPGAESTNLAHAAGPAGAGSGAGEPSAASLPTAGTATANAEPAAKPVRSKATDARTPPRPPARSSPPRDEAAAVQGKPGVIVVRVKTWAQVWIDEKAAGTTPARVTIGPGSHQVLMINEQRRETATVVVRPNAEVVVERDW
jgi:serine/threonine-protein kinase